EQHAREERVQAVDLVQAEDAGDVLVRADHDDGAVTADAAGLEDVLAVLGGAWRRCCSGRAGRGTGGRPEDRRHVRVGELGLLCWYTPSSSTPAKNAFRRSTSSRPKTPETYWSGRTTTTA
ncbi:hypothetical protein ACNQUF_12545, partial [Corynebacterium diphtheriae]